jgi:hypothetical protein
MAGPTSETVFTGFRSEKREVRGSMPRPTTCGVLTRVRPRETSASTTGDLASQKREVAFEDEMFAPCHTPFSGFVSSFRAHNMPTRNWDMFQVEHGGLSRDG